jgi:hypothetical protein
MNRPLVFGIVITAVLFGCARLGLSEDAGKGPEEMILQAVKDKEFTPKPAKFPHARHQAAYSCGECHHTLKDGKKIPHSEGMAAKKCEECHYTGSAMPNADDEDKGIIKLDTFKNAAHAQCRSCHDRASKIKPELKTRWKNCLPCHV